ncbi:amidohydrolase family protein [Paenibacillus plantarum]|uniref:amidohydrolase family protein n=1 Tax=Paenibacillus plantarum TaxID=2654975 RepID=UPI0028A6E336|nr:amidohydrolase family protein [Paenibacillus plantarum]
MTGAGAPLIIDTHVHLWRPDRGDYGWLKPENPVLYRDYLPQHVQPELARKGVTAVVAVQAAATVAETEYLLTLGDHFGWIAGVVGWLDVASGDFVKQYERLRRNPRFVGIRVNGSTFAAIQDGEPLSQLSRNLRHMADDGFPVDLLLRLGEMPSVIKLLREVPHLKAAVNHLGVPPVLDQSPKDCEAWNSLMRELAEYAGVVCKLSGMITQSRGYDVRLWRPYVEQLVAAFGPQRLLFGSDWPVCLQAGGYDEVMRLFHEVLRGLLDESALARICGDNAVSFYQLQAVGLPGLGGDFK